MKILKPEFIRKDKRGKLVQVSIGNWKQLNVLEVKKHNTFGGHYHKKKKELFYLIKGKIDLIILKKDHLRVWDLEEGDCFLVEPYESHTVEALEDSILVEVLSKPYSEEDTYKY